jgi:hypothetical protein
MEISDSLHDRLKTQQETISELIEDLDPQKIQDRIVPDKWSIHENIAHLAKYQVLFGERVRQILDTKEPIFARYRAEDDPDFVEWCKWSTEQLLSRLEKDRQFLFTYITQLTSSQLDRIGIHQKFGKLTLTQWIEFFLLHEAHHCFTIFQLAHPQ